MSIVFKWRKEDFDSLVKSCSRDSATPYILKYMPKNGRIVEAGCGLGRYVVYLSKMGFDIEGVEISGDTVDVIKRRLPDLKVIQGNISRLPYADNSISGVISLGVVEHFIDGPELPLREMNRVLKPDCFAIITVPSLNYIRMLKYKSGYYALKVRLKQIDFIRRLFGKELLHKKVIGNRKYKYMPYIVSGEFFEYLFAKEEFEGELVKVGFKIIESVPIATMDGIYHEFGKTFVSFRNWEFQPNILGRLLNDLLSKIPFCHNHMHLCVESK